MRFSEEKIIGILKEAETAGNARAICREHSITEQTFVKLYPGAHVIIWACGPSTSTPLHHRPTSRNTGRSGGILRLSLDA